MNLTRRDMVARAAAACAAATLLPWQAADAQQAWPAKPIKLVNMGPPGSPPDTYGRIYAERLSKVLGVPVIVENRPGAAQTSRPTRSPRRLPTATHCSTPYRTPS